MSDEKGLIQYKLDNGDEMTLTPTRVKELLVSGDKDNVTDKEVINFMMLCKAHRLNPFLREAYLIKFGSNPATMVTGKEVFTKRAQKNPRFKGFEAGISILSSDGSKLSRRDGSMPLPGEKIVGGWCKVYIDGYEKPIFDEVSFDEYAGKKRDGGLNGQWSSKPGTMIRKVALVHALREAFPDDFGGLYDACEMGVDEEDLPDNTIDIEPIEVENVEKPADKTEPKKEASAETAVNEAGIAPTRSARCEFCGNEFEKAPADVTLEDLNDLCTCEHPNYKWVK